MAEVHLGYFENFKANDTILLEGDAEGLRHLVQVLRSLETGSADLIEIEALPFVRSHHGVRLTARRAPRDFVARVDAYRNSFSWERTAAGWQDAADKVQVLAGCREGHHYLDTAHDQVVVEVAKGEYGDDWWTRHG